jgi:UDP-perosamine 4-acetyltransferase
MKILILGAGGHARVLLHSLRSAKQKVAAFADKGPGLVRWSFDGVPVLPEEEALRRYPPGSILLVNGLGLNDSTGPRRRLYERLKRQGYTFASVRDPEASIALDAIVAEGAEILTRSVLHSRAFIGKNAVVNTGAIVEHDCVVGSHAFLGPGAILCGGVKVGEGAFICAGAVVVPEVSVGPGCLVAAGAVVTRDLPAGTRAAGVPAREIRG